VDPSSYRKWDVELPPRVALYAFIQFVPVLVGSALVLSLQDSLSRTMLAAAGLLVVASLVALGGLLERKPWAIGLEALRLALLAGWSVSAVSTLIAALVILAAAASLFWLLRLRVGVGRAASDGTA
jgi:hypothetical protein